MHPFGAAKDCFLYKALPVAPRTHENGSRMATPWGKPGHATRSPRIFSIGMILAYLTHDTVVNIL